MIDLGTGNNNKINWAMEDKQELIDIVETVYRGQSCNEVLPRFWDTGIRLLEHILYKIKVVESTHLYSVVIGWLRFCTDLSKLLLVND